MTHAKKLQKQRNLETGYEEMDILAAYDYQITEFSGYHYRINDRLDVWPSSKKWYDKTLNSGGTYETLMQLVKDRML